MSDGQMTMLRSARRVGGPGHLLHVLDAAEVLLEAGYTLEQAAELLRVPVQGNVTALERLREGLAITALWNPDLLLRARQVGADWHALYEPARWWQAGKVEREDVEAFTREMLERLGRWPTVSEMRRRFGYAPTHRGPGDAPGQEQLT